MAKLSFMQVPQLLNVDQAGIRVGQQPAHTEGEMWKLLYVTSLVREAETEEDVVVDRGEGFITPKDVFFCVCVL